MPKFKKITLNTEGQNEELKPKDIAIAAAALVKGETEAFFNLDINGIPMILSFSAKKKHVKKMKKENNGLPEEALKELQATIEAEDCELVSDEILAIAGVVHANFSTKKFNIAVEKLIALLRVNYEYGVTTKTFTEEGA